MSVTFGRFSHSNPVSSTKINWSPRYYWNSNESGIKHHIPNSYISLSKNSVTFQCRIFVCTSVGNFYICCRCVCYMNQDKDLNFFLEIINLSWTFCIDGLKGWNISLILLDTLRPKINYCLFPHSWLTEKSVWLKLFYSQNEVKIIDFVDAYHPACWKSGGPTMFP